MLKNENNHFNIVSGYDFKAAALEAFRLQYKNNTVYNEWCQHLNIKPDRVSEIKNIPFLPIEFFKSRLITTGVLSNDAVCFTSSGTISQIPSRHFVSDVTVYEKSFLSTFKLFYGSPRNYCILALLPKYLERTGSSLVYMCNRLIKESGHPASGFFLRERLKLLNAIELLKKNKQKTLLIGVSYALLDLCETGLTLTDDFIVMETGGMKGTRKEMLKSEMHEILRKGFGIKTIHSEYGMTELLSQAYSDGQGLFKCPPWMRVLTREIDDPLKLMTDQRTGGINVIDLANINSCCFIATKDLGRVYSNGHFELLGRYDQSDVRGCNLLVEDLS